MRRFNFVRHKVGKTPNPFGHAPLYVKREENTDGEYVLYSDHLADKEALAKESLAKEITESKAENALLKAGLVFIRDCEDGAASFLREQARSLLWGLSDVPPEPPVKHGEEKL